MPQAKWQGAVLANSDATIIIEGNHYSPPDSVDRQYFQGSNTHSTCPCKGEASYYTIKVGDQVNPDAAWYYPAPKEAAAEIKDYVAFWKDAEFHTDAVQGMGKIPVDVDELGIDLLSVSAHKMYGPKGTGGLYVRKGIGIAPLIQGGGQEFGLRSGTENVPAIVGFGRACELAGQRLQANVSNETGVLRDYLQEKIMAQTPGAKRNGSITSCLSNTLNNKLGVMRFVPCR